MTPEERLAALVTRANAQFVVNAERLQKRFPGSMREITPLAVAMRLASVTHELSDRMTKHNGLSYVGRCLIRYDRKLFLRADDDYLFDLVLHEIGHQWVEYFLDPEIGHGEEWQWVGWIVGYVPRGSMSDRKRRSWHEQMIVHRTFAAAGHFNPLLNI